MSDYQALDVQGERQVVEERLRRLEIDHLTATLALAEAEADPTMDQTNPIIEDYRRTIKSTEARRKVTSDKLSQYQEKE